jgi:hypothetical protein
MSRKWRIPLLVAITMMLLAGISLSQQLTPKFTPKDREVIEGYYAHILGALAPGSLDRSPFPLGVEQALVVGGHIPMSVEKDLERLPEKLESQLSQITRNYGCYKLGRHIILVKKEDGVIADILKNVALKQSRT